ncbi:MAG TPA: DNA repair protein RadC [Dehalococcoidales bacterium]|nr:DNA repair protein RadC [Dehalococcoidales bacterium]
MTVDRERVEKSPGKAAAGHRKRLREKFIESGLAGFHDYEIVELLLSLGTPRHDCKPQAKEAIKKFKTLRGVLSASLQELQQIEGIGPHSAFGIKLVQEVARKFLREGIIDQPVYKSSREVFDYLYHAMRDLKKEVFKVIYLNTQHQIIETDDLFQGTLNSSFVPPREVVESALGKNAAAVIFAHNHPSGNSEPSQSDKQLTRDLVYAGSIMQVRVLDHIIIGDNRYFSFASEGLIEEYEADFLGLKMRGTAEAKRRRYRAKSSPEPRLALDESQHGYEDKKP